MEEMNFWDDADIISMYTLQDAVRDGSLIPLSSMGEKIAALGREAGIIVPVYFTGNVYADVVKKKVDVAGRIWDILSVYRIRGSKGMDVQYIGGRWELVPKNTQPDRITPFIVRVGRKNLHLWGVVENEGVVIMYPEEY